MGSEQGNFISKEAGTGISTCIFEGRCKSPWLQVVNVDAGSYLCMTPEKALSKAEKEKKDLYFQACLEHRKTVTPMFYSEDRIPGAKALSAQMWLDVLLIYKMKREYFEMCGFVRARMSLAIVRSNSLLICAMWDKGGRIRQHTELTDGRGGDTGPSWGEAGARGTRRRLTGKSGSRTLGSGGKQRGPRGLCSGPRVPRSWGGGGGAQGLRSGRKPWGGPPQSGRRSRVASGRRHP